MQEGASVHTKPHPLEHLCLYCHILEDWPSASLDLNPIQDLWAIMKDRASEVGATTTEEMESVVFAVWQGRQPDELQKPRGLYDKLVASNNRCQRRAKAPMNQSF
jgi:hypothetical protein